MRNKIFILLIGLLWLSNPLLQAQPVETEQLDQVTVETDVGVDVGIINQYISADSYVLKDNPDDQLVLSIYHYASDNFVNKLNLLATESLISEEILKVPEIQSFIKCINLDETKAIMNKLLNDDGGLLSLFSLAALELPSYKQRL